MAELVRYGWESGDPNPPGGESGGLAVVETKPHSGAKHIEADAADSKASSHRAAWTTKDKSLPAGANERDYFLRIYVEVTALPESSIVLCSLGNLAGGFFGELLFQKDGTLKLRRNGSINVGSDSPKTSASYFYAELRVRLGKESGKGQIEGRLNGEAFAVNNATNLGAGLSPDELRVGVCNSAGGTGGVTVRVDDVALHDDQGEKDNSWPGALKADQAPTVDTKEADGIGGAVATLHGDVNPEGLSTSCWFEYGETEAYGTKTEAQDAGDGEETVPIEQAIKGLKPETTYHFRIGAENEIGESQGDDVTLETGPGPSGDPIKTSFAADHEAGNLTEYSGWPEGDADGGVVSAVPRPLGKGGVFGGFCVETTVTAPGGYARVQLNTAETSWQIGERVWWGGLLYLPEGFFVAKQGQVDFFRWDNFAQDPVTTDRSGVCIFGEGKTLRLVQLTEPDEQVTLITGPELEEQRWYWIEAEQVLWHEDGLAVNQLYVYDDKAASIFKGSSSDRNCSRSDLVVSRHRCGFPGTNDKQENDITVYVDRIRVGPEEFGPPSVKTKARSSGVWKTVARWIKAGGKWLEA